jgi:hypothetical protein
MKTTQFNGGPELVLKAAIVRRRKPCGQIAQMEDLRL